MSLGNVSGKIIHQFVIGGFDTLDRPLTVGIVILCIYLLVMLSNVANICFILHDKRLHKPMYLLICNLALVDMLYSSSACPTMIGVLVAGDKAIAYVSCFIQMFVFHLGGVMEMFAISVMAFDRLIAISNPLRYQSILTNVRTLVLTGALWLVACAFVAVMPATVLSLPYCHSTLKYTFCDYAALVRATCVNPILVLHVPFVFIVLSYVCILLALFRITTWEGCVKALKTCTSHLLRVALFLLPFISTYIAAVTFSLHPNARIICLSLASAIPLMLNPVIYVLNTEEIRTGKHKDRRQTVQQQGTEQGN
uniref:G-protein coupled receptors family 1 profile domain-containing protein n=1 Tax=Oncorhynchus mykiss TaxID=8022 RepID=A0A8C7WE91_ONCMY